MGMTRQQKILAAHAGPPRSRRHSSSTAKLDIVLGNDITTPVAINEFEKAGFNGVFSTKSPSTIVPRPLRSQQGHQERDPVQAVPRVRLQTRHRQLLRRGQDGHEHALLPRQGIVTAGDCIIGADSHTCTYGAVGAFSTGVGSTDMAAGMATGKAWFKVPAAIKFVTDRKLRRPKVSGKDVISTSSDDRRGWRAVISRGVHRPGRRLHYPWTTG